MRAVKSHSSLSERVARVPALRVRRLGVWLAGMMLCACKSITGLPNLDHHLVNKSNPSVNDLIQHTNCEIAKAMNEHIRQKNDFVWDHLWQDNFVASIDFTLTATNSEGFDPSISGTLPTYSLGGKISPIVGTSSTVTSAEATSAMYSKTLAVGLQANRTQDRNLDVSYIVDLSRIADVIRDPTVSDPVTTICGAHDTTGNVGLTYVGLQGDLELGETMQLGLQALDQGKQYSVYGTSGPQSRADAGVVQNPPPTKPENQKYAGVLDSQRWTEFLDAQSVSSAMTPSGGGKQGSGGAQTGSASFSSRIDFTIVEGLNGGPSFNLLTWKVGGGAGGGGGAGAGGGGPGGAGAGGAGAGAGGGGGGQMFNWNRTVVDSLVVTFVPTCSSLVDPLLARNSLPYVAGDPDQVFSWWVAANDGNDGLYLVYRIVIPKISNPLVGELRGTAPPVKGPSLTAYKARWLDVAGTKQLLPTNDPPQYGTIQWTGYYSPGINSDRSLDSNSARLKLELRGAISAPLANNSDSVGTITLRGDGPAFALQGHITTGLYEALSDNQRTQDYWRSIQSCDLITAAQRQNAMGNATGINQLFKLTNEQRQRLLQ